MAKSNYLFGILLCASVLFYTYVEFYSLREKYQVSSIKNQDTWGVRMRVAGFQEKSIDKGVIVKRIYTSQIGIREVGPNAGKQVESYLRYVGLQKGEPWCAAFVCWVYGRAGIENPRTGWSPTLFPTSKVIWSRATKASKMPSTGDVFGIYFPEKDRIAHAGFVDSWDGRWLVTVEGNTNESGSREGDGVYRKRRLVSSIYKVARYINLERRVGL